MSSKYGLIKFNISKVEKYTKLHYDKINVCVIFYAICLINSARHSFKCARNCTYLREIFLFFRKSYFTDIIFYIDIK